MVCIRCPEYTRSGSVICESCRALLDNTLNLVPEQLSSSEVLDPAFYVIDSFGRAHTGGSGGMVLGRRQELGGLAILVPGVSRFHARIEPCDEASGFLIRDLGSTNGTFLEGEPVVVMPLRWGQIVRVGEVAMFFEAPEIDVGLVAPKSAPTALRSPFVRRATTEVEDFSGGPRSNGGAPSGALRLTEASGGGGGLLTLNDASIKLTLPQFELVEILLAQARADSNQDAGIRGFVSTGEIIATISWDTARPDDNNVKQLVRRVRSSLRRAAFPELIDSAAGFGYRLVPNIPI